MVIPFKKNIVKLKKKSEKNIETLNKFECIQKIISNVDKHIVYLHKLKNNMIVQVEYFFNIKLKYIFKYMSIIFYY